MRLPPPSLAIAFATLIAFPLTAGETKGRTAETLAAPAAEAAMKVHVDPATGQIVSPKSDPGSARSVSAAAAAERARPLHVEKVMTRAGGKKVNLEGRFLMEMTVTAGADGKVTSTCVSADEGGTKAPATTKEHGHDR